MLRVVATNYGPTTIHHVNFMHTHVIVFLNLTVSVKAWALRQYGIHPKGGHLL